ncbi:hypothetical protein EXIGLDRAFT_768119 [Exidia glandulosa HHB12029]|uniref:Uncharacterized protein n=1 Tax=Exidia glandulosa HHB12029 TaxID=1314781 RepID=A0A165IFT1_EXIGL|nr:hypothetical protein EXIGLDRAFT_768119 [Exidia glandulosa HHB12029]
MDTSAVIHEVYVPPGSESPPSFPPPQSHPLPPPPPSFSHGLPTRPPFGSADLPARPQVAVDLPPRPVAHTPSHMSLASASGSPASAHRTPWPAVALPQRPGTGAPTHAASPVSAHPQRVEHTPHHHGAWTASSASAHANAALAAVESDIDPKTGLPRPRSLGSAAQRHKRQQLLGDEKKDEEPQPPTTIDPSVLQEQKDYKIRSQILTRWRAARLDAIKATQELDMAELELKSAEMRRRVLDDHLQLLMSGTWKEDVESAA